MANVRSRIQPAAWAALGLIAFAILLRMPQFGDPAADIDEQYYLLVGDRMLRGAIPYVDLWDRKPIGLFLIYAGSRLLGDVAMLHLIAALFAGGTAAMICAIAHKPAGWVGGIGAGVAYLLWIETIDGGGGQSPVFYNLPVAIAAWATWRALAAADAARFRRLAFAAMALTGLAIQIKYTALFEGGYFGLLLAWASRRHSRNLPAAAALSLALAITALAPTLAAASFYRAIGDFDAFWFANFVSIFRRPPTPDAEIGQRLRAIATHILPFALCGAASAWAIGRQADHEPGWRRFVGGWIAAALTGFVSVGTFYVHYALPLFVPFAVAAAPIFRRRPIGPVVLGTLLWIPASNLAYPDFATTRRSQREFAALTAVLPADVAGRCLQLLAGPPALYRVTNACLVSRFAFPDHLVGAHDAGAIGVDQKGEIARIIHARPRAIVTGETPEPLLLQQLRDAGYARVGDGVLRGSRYAVWKLD